MSRKRRRLAILLAAMSVLGAAALLVLNAFEDSLVFFYSPSDLASGVASGDRVIRLGGLVADGSVEQLSESGGVRFVVTDTQTSLPVVYIGVLPDLFREGQGIVAQGRLDPTGVFRADEVLAKHDETYLPPEVADALRRAGHVADGEAPRAVTLEPAP
ncbi:MAG: cytochrome c maturation protein CcmE [Alphaproteobacteria bacterium]